MLGTVLALLPIETILALLPIETQRCGSSLLDLYTTVTLCFFNPVWACYLTVMISANLCSYSTQEERLKKTRSCHVLTSVYPTHLMQQYLHLSRKLALQMLQLL